MAFHRRFRGARATGRVGLKVPTGWRRLVRGIRRVHLPQTTTAMRQLARVRFRNAEAHGKIGR
jgi:hypothetical protein